MKNILLLLFLLLGIQSIPVFSQERVEWKVMFNQEKNQIEWRATIDDGWHLYSQFLDAEIGPVPTSFTILKGNEFVSDSKVTEPQPIEEYDPNFEAKLNYFKGEVVFYQKVKKNVSGKISGTITFMACNESQCLPPHDVPFEIELK